MGVVRDPDINKDTHQGQRFPHNVREDFTAVASLDWRPKPELELSNKKKRVLQVSCSKTDLVRISMKELYTHFHSN